jgi:hypothetical protein
MSGFKSHCPPPPPSFYHVPSIRPTSTVPAYNIPSSSSIIKPSNSLTLSESTAHSATSFNKENNAPYGESYSPLTRISPSTPLNPYSTRVEQQNVSRCSCCSRTMTILTFNQKVLDEAQAANSKLTKKNELLQVQLLEEKQKNKGKRKKGCIFRYK